VIAVRYWTLTKLSDAIPALSFQRGDIFLAMRLSLELEAPNQQMA